MNKGVKNNDLMSPRHSAMVWVAGITLGWGIAVVGVYQWIKVTNNAPVVASKAAVVAKNTDLRGRDGKNLSDIAPAAGKSQTEAKNNQ